MGEFKKLDYLSITQIKKCLSPLRYLAVDSG